MTAAANREQPDGKLLRADGRYEDCLGDCGQGGLYCCDGAWDDLRKATERDAATNTERCADCGEPFTADVCQTMECGFQWQHVTASEPEAIAVVQEAARALSEAVYEWWSCLRPRDFTEAEHFADPTVNCANERERDLALALVALLRNERDDV